mmetsp:Transcript_2893/g.7226  ORF Transcript_2893/g.7226 Transcript_2893/m.7226 type:complete len:380 (-) Transcript_2893:369-1508(-)
MSIGRGRERPELRQMRATSLDQRSHAAPDRAKFLANSDTSLPHNPARQAWVSQQTRSNAEVDSELARRTSADSDSPKRSGANLGRSSNHNVKSPASQLKNSSQAFAPLSPPAPSDLFHLHLLHQIPRQTSHRWVVEHDGGGQIQFELLLQRRPQIHARETVQARLHQRCVTVQLFAPCHVLDQAENVRPDELGIRRLIGNHLSYWRCCGRSRHLLLHLHRHVLHHGHLFHHFLYRHLAPAWNLIGRQLTHQVVGQAADRRVVKHDRRPQSHLEFRLQLRAKVDGHQTVNSRLHDRGVVINLRAGHALDHRRNLSAHDVGLWPREHLLPHQRHHGASLLLHLPWNQNVFHDRDLLHHLLKCDLAPTGHLMCGKLAHQVVG